VQNLVALERFLSTVSSFPTEAEQVYLPSVQLCPSPNGHLVRL